MSSTQREESPATRTVEAVRALAEAIRHARRTLVIASGSHLAPAILLAHVGVLFGLDIDYDGTGGTRRAGLATRIGPGDCPVVFNVWRLPRDVLRSARLAKGRELAPAVSDLGWPCTPAICMR